MIAAFYKGTRPGLQGIANRAIRFVDRGEYSHCELIFSDGISASSSLMDGGVRFKEIHFKPEHWDFVDLPEDETAARRWFTIHAGQKYDIWGDARFIIGLARHSNDRWFCSEAMAEALGIPESWRFGPNGLASILRWRIK